MKLALRWIPAEVWVDVFVYPWITREELGRIVHRFRNRKFCELLQYCLHDRGKRMLKKIYLGKMSDIPLTPLPENIKFFEKIIISQFDWRTLDFLRQVSGLFTTNNVNLHLSAGPGDVLTNFRTVLDHLMPLLHGIHSIAFGHKEIPLIDQYFGPQLGQVKMLSLNLFNSNPTTLQTSITFCMNWLAAEERGPAEPRLLDVYIHSELVQQFGMAIQEQFHSAKSPCTFVIRLVPFRYVTDSPVDTNFRLDLRNHIGEELHGQFDEDGDFWIYRHPVDFPSAQLKEWAEKTDEKRWKSRIWFSYELTIGLIDANGGENGENDAAEHEEKEADQPSTS